MRVECDTCGAWIDASPIQCEAWLLDHPPGHPSWRIELDATQRDIWGTGYDTISENLAAKRERKRTKSAEKRASGRLNVLRARRAKLEAEIRLIDANLERYFD